MPYKILIFNKPINSQSVKIKFYIVKEILISTFAIENFPAVYFSFRCFFYR